MNKENILVEKERKNAQHHEGASFKTTALSGKKLMRKTTPNRNKKKNPKYQKVWDNTEKKQLKQKQISQNIKQNMIKSIIVNLI